MRINESTLGKATIIDLEGNIDLFNTRELKETIERLMQADQPRLIVNMERVAYVDSSGIGVFLSMLKPLRAMGGDLKLSALSPAVAKVFQLTRLNSFFDIHNESTAAERAFS